MFQDISQTFDQLKLCVEVVWSKPISRVCPQKTGDKLRPTGQHEMQSYKCLHCGSKFWLVILGTMQSRKLYETSDQKTPGQLEGMTARKSIARFTHASAPGELLVFDASVVLTHWGQDMNFILLVKSSGKKAGKASLSTGCK